MEGGSLNSLGGRGEGVDLAFGLGLVLGSFLQSAAGTAPGILAETTPLLGLVVVGPRNFTTPADVRVAAGHPRSMLLDSDLDRNGLSVLNLGRSSFLPCVAGPAPGILAESNPSLGRVVLRPRNFTTPADIRVAEAHPLSVLMDSDMSCWECFQAQVLGFGLGA